MGNAALSQQCARSAQSHDQIVHVSQSPLAMGIGEPGTQQGQEPDFGYVVHQAFTHSEPNQRLLAMYA